MKALNESTNSKQKQNNRIQNKIKKQRKNKELGKLISYKI